MEEVFGKHVERVQMETVTMLIWQFRDDPRVVQYVAQFLTQVRKTDIDIGIDIDIIIDIHIGTQTLYHLYNINLINCLSYLNITSILEHVMYLME